MRYLKMLPGIAAMVDHPVWCEKVATLAREHTGIVYPSVKRGTYVEQGKKVGYIAEYLGKPYFKSPRAGCGCGALYVCVVPSMTKGATIANPGVVARDRGFLQFV